MTRAEEESRNLTLIVVIRARALERATRNLANAERELIAATLAHATHERILECHPDYHNEEVT